MRRRGAWVAICSAWRIVYFMPAADAPTNQLFCFGLGFSARALARALPANGWQIKGTHRPSDHRAEPGKYETLPFQRGAPLHDTALAGTTHLLSSIPPDETGDPVLDMHRRDIAALSSLRWVGYLSTTGVYGDLQGGRVDEAGACRPTNERSKRRLSAEKEWLSLWQNHGVPVHVFRLAGIYGPGRSAIDTVRAGRAKRIVKPGQVFSRIHVDDIAGVLQASIERPAPGTIYNVCDDEAAPPQDVVRHACELLGVAPPPEIPFEDAELSPMARSFYSDNRRVSNQRIKEELGVALRFPDYRIGLAAILADGG